MASSGVWLEFDQIRHNIKNNTVDKLKHILSGLNEECGAHLSKSGKKQEIIDRIVATLDSWRAGNVEDRWIKAKGVVNQVRIQGTYAPPTRLPAIPAVLPPAVVPLPPYNAGVSKSVFQSVAGPSGVGRYDPYAPPRKAVGPPTTIPPASSPPKPPGIRFKESPFFQIEQAVSSVTECPESTSATDRRQQTVTFTLNTDQIAKLKAPGSKYQLRLFCTSSIFYSGSSSFRTSIVPCPIEFPPTCEVRVNNVQLSANLKGLKKKPGTAPPPDLGNYTRLTNLQNRVEMVYVNSQQPAQSKKYYLVVMLVETIKVEQLVSNLMTKNYRSSRDVRQKMIESMTEDDDIVAGPQKMSLKCPLSFMRVNTPCRSAKCVHSQCFDATSWFSMMEQTTTWLCPVCERVLDCKDLIIDGYFDEILKQSPESVEDVMVEADGEWHTSDNKYGSSLWKSTHPATNILKPPPTPQKSLQNITTAETAIKPSSDEGGDTGTKRKANAHEIFVLDSDDEDEGRVKRELSPSNGSGSSAPVSQSFDGHSTNSAPQTHTRVDDVIDLTLDSDEEEPRTSRQTGKRKASEAELTVTSPTEQIWKKGRLDPDRAIGSAAPRPPNDVEQTRSATTVRPVIRPPVPDSPNSYTTLLHGPPLSPMYTNLPARGGSTTSTPQLPPLASTFMARMNGGSRWP